MKQSLYTLAAIFILVLAGNTQVMALEQSNNINEEKEKFLPVDEAFALNHENSLENTVTINFDIADHYYLYKKRLNIKVDGREIVLEDLPPAEDKMDPYFGQVKIYHERLFFPVRLPEGGANSIEVGYQGCAEGGLCYPPQKRLINLGAPGTSEDYESTSDKYLNSFGEKSALYTLLIYFLVGVATAFAGCSYPMFPILSKIIIGQKETTRLKSFSLSLSYVLPIAIVYAAIGILAGVFGSNLANWFQTPAALVFISVMLFAMALSMFGLYEIQMPSSIQTRLSSISNSQNGGSYASAAIMGFISAFIVSACVVPPVVAAVTYITKTGNIWLGASAMFCFGIGLGSPLLLLGLSAGWLLPKAGGWMDKVQRLMGIFLITAAIWIIDRVIPDWLTFLLWASLAAFTSLYLLKLFQSKVAIAASVGSAVLAIFLLISGFSKQMNPEVDPYEYVESVSEMEVLLTNSEHPVFVDFYADWCTACKHMEGKVFHDPGVSAQLKQFRRVKIDLSQMNAENRKLMKQYDVIGPPAFLFFTAEGKEIKSLRIVGEMDIEEFSSVLSRALNHQAG